MRLGALRTAAPYIQAYRGRTFVVKLGGALCNPGRVLDHLVDQLALLHKLGIRLIVVHGGGPQADALARRLGIEPVRHAGRRITDAPMLDIARMAFAGTVNTGLVAAFRRVRIPAVGLSGIDAGLTTARRRPVQCVENAAGGTTHLDFGHVGDLTAVDARPLEHLLDGGFVPVICSLTADEDGNILNINADTIAARVAVAVKAAKYFLVTEVDGVLRDVDDPATLQSYLDLAQLDELVESGIVRGGMLPKLAACAAALRGGVPRVHIVNGTAADTLLGEVFTNEGCGTLLVRERESADSPATPSGEAAT